ncbi:SpoIIE family protein phosphatase [Streptomyces sp. ICBB 8177]|uniref:SpoIIE family protein phosphatase n=1 Tax=Streptomyces sp. ICBB 8177 TaxID=563922 RepID=UPI000D678097|nr:SpoIIE family protein phosphatase [Streptomyces sp. ICBB 8177]PWI43912.1 protein phosphatase [Streptomyces sp. ICBB 8177]
MTTGPDAPPPHDPPLPPLPDASGELTGGLLDALRVGIVMMDTRGRVVLWSPLAEEMLGWAGEHIVGRRIEHIIEPGRPAADPAPGTASRSAADPAPRTASRSAAPGTEPGRDLADRLLAELMRAGRWGGVLPMRHRDGHTLQVEVRASLLVDGDGKPFVLASLADTRLLRDLEHDLAVVDAVFDTAALGIAIFDTDLRYVRVNQALARMNRLPVEGHLGRTVKEVRPGRAGEELTMVQREVLTTGRTVVDLLVPGPDGDGYRSTSYSRITDHAGRVLGISCVVMDVTDRFMASAKVERTRHRLAVLSDVGGVLSELMDVDRRAQSLAEALVPGFCDYAGVLVVRDIAAGGELPREPLRGGTPLVLLGVATGPDQAEVAALLRPGGRLSFPEGSPLSDVLAGGPAWFAETPADLRGGAFSPLGDPRIKAALDLGVGSLLAVPLRARDVVLGLLIVGRAVSRDPFDADDLALAYELADRAGAALDNARLYAREREGALMIQRSLLPQRVPRLPGVEVAFRYVPGSTGAEAGGDWFDVVPLAGGRVALVVGDVMGHGLRAAATMGRLRTAVRTLAGLDMAPDELLRRINDLSEDFAPGPDEPMMATFVYAVYDPSTRTCVVATAGHLPPLLIDPAAPGEHRVRQIEVPPNTPIGVFAVEFESAEVEVPDGAVLVLYTDGLVERRGEDITEGVDRLRGILGRPYDFLEDLCDDVVVGMVPQREPDDVALMAVRLGGLPEGSTMAWTFPAEPSAVRRARRHVRTTLAGWDLSALSDVTVLLVSELVTNSLRHAHGPIGVRMVRGASLLVEVSDPLPDPPRARAAADDDEGGRGMHLVARASRRWGTRQGPLGKTVWFELALPGSRPG